jgi:hypothetical protein
MGQKQTRTGARSESDTPTRSSGLHHITLPDTAGPLRLPSDSYDHLFTPNTSRYGQKRQSRVRIEHI